MTPKKVRFDIPPTPPSSAATANSVPILPPEPPSPSTEANATVASIFPPLPPLPSLSSLFWSHSQPTTVSVSDDKKGEVEEEKEDSVGVEQSHSAVSTSPEARSPGNDHPEDDGEEEKEDAKHNEDGADNSTPTSIVVSMSTSTAAGTSPSDDEHDGLRVRRVNRKASITEAWKYLTSPKDHPQQQHHSKPATAFTSPSTNASANQRSFAKSQPGTISYKHDSST